MDKKKTRKKRRAYLDDFQKNLSGEYIYTGDVFHWEKDRRKSLALMWVAAFVTLGCAIGAGCSPSAGMQNNPFVLIPYVFTVWGGGTQLWAVAQLNGAGEEVRAYVLERSAKKLPVRALITAVSAGIAILTELAIIFYASVPYALSGEVIFLILQIVQVLEGIWMYRFSIRLRWIK